MTDIKTILCLEDDVFISDMYSRSLRQAGYAVDVIADGQEGLKTAISKQYDLILLDILLPHQQGTEILKALRGGPQDLVPHSRILVFTNFHQDEESRQAMAARADGYLIKADITPRKLLGIIEELKRPA